MTRGIRRGVVAAVVGACVALSGAVAAVAAPVAGKPFTITATELHYGQPDLNGRRHAENTITFTNTTKEAIEFPVLTFPLNGRDHAEHANWSGCPYMTGSSGQLVCVAEPIAAGASTTLTLPWETSSRPPGGVGRVRIEKGVDREGTVQPGTAARASWRVTFARLTGTFDITATDLRYGPVEADGFRRGSTTVTITNLTKRTVPYPLISFPLSAGDPESTLWTDCPVFDRPDETLCQAAPLPAGASATLTLPFLTKWSWTEFEANVRVDAGADDRGTVIEGTAAGTQYTVHETS